MMTRATRRHPEKTPHPALAFLAGPPVLCAALFFAGCVEFNECDREQGQRIGTAALELDVRESVVRTQESAVGNLVTDAYRKVAGAFCQTGAVPCPDIAIQNSGGIREETACGTIRESIKAGPIYEIDIQELMPFDNEVVVVSVKGEDLLMALERSVSELGQVGEAGQAGAFLQVSGISYEVDCEQQAQVLALDRMSVQVAGQRISNVVITSQEPPVPLDPQADYEVAMNSFIGGGNDGFLGFLQRDADGNVLTNAQGDPLAKLDPATDTLTNENGAPMTYSEPMLRWIRDRDGKGLAVGQPPEGRIKQTPACYQGAVGGG
jgi:2',3'-cyclic-nucleotide 2'-phosphodiesterase (5'-nucleotidase family)